MTLPTITKPNTGSGSDEIDRHRPVEVAVSAELAELAKTWTAPKPPPAPRPTPATESRVRFDRD